MKKCISGVLAAALIIIVSPTFSWKSEAAIRKSRIVMDFEPVCDTLDSLIAARTTVKGELELKAVMKRGNVLDFYFTVSLSDWPWSAGDAKWLRKELKQHFPDKYRALNVGNLFSNGIRLDRLVTPELSFNGSPADSPHRIDGHRGSGAPIVENLQKPRFSNGLANRHIALWQSHGRYFEQSMDRWEWQRPCLFQTAEDIFTQSFVLPYLVPMLENAGACTFLPRERDIQTNEIIVDNDPSFERIPGTASRGTGQYSETGDWEDAGTGFGDSLMTYTGLDNPFSMGSARMAAISKKKGGGSPQARWTPDIPEKGEYAVYVSYKSLPESTDKAEYTVRHLGGVSRFVVNQRMGGGTWIYLGTFMFDKGSDGYVCLKAAGEKDASGARRTGGVITADAVKFGGGMGNIARKIFEDSTAVAEVSGLPRFVEGARYWMQWSGVDTTVYSQNEQKNDYMDDFMSRGAWVGWLSGGSPANPEGEGLVIPIDLSFGFHSDAGVTPNDSTIGTLSIYTLRCDGSRRLPDGEDRMTCREYADIVQSQIVRDLRAQYDPIWNRRSLWDRSYSESRTPPVPAMLLELMSHQNFSDMRYGLDPAFRFTVSRAVYKGILKYLSNRYGCNYVVQPLPVNSFAVRFAGPGQKSDTRKTDLTQASTLIELSWKATADTLEPTAVPQGYILYTRVDSGAFDNGRVLKETKKENGKIRFTTRIEPGHIYSFRLTAWNSGGESFPSETLSIGIPENGGTNSASEGSDTPDKKAAASGPVLVVNNFSRISAPVSFDTPQYAGFDNRIDSGVPYIRDISFMGEMYQFRRDMPWTDDDNPGFGASSGDYAGKVIAGNTFDYPYIHGKAIMKAGRPFCSAGADAFVSDSTLSAGIRDIDLICGKQVTVKTGCGTMPDRYRVFTPEMQLALTRHAANSGNILISGSKIATDIWDRVYEVSCDSTFRAESIRFAENILGYRWITGFAGKTGEVKWSGIPGEKGRPAGTSHTSAGPDNFGFNTDYSSRIYRVEAPDGIAPVHTESPGQDAEADSADSGTFLKYKDSNISAGTWLDTGNRKVMAIGFPLETILQEEAMERIIGEALDFFEK